MNGSSPILRKNSCSSFQLGDGTATIGSLNELRGTRNAMEQRSRYDSLLLSNSTSVVLSGFTLSLCRGVDKATYHICGHQHCRGYGCSWATAVRHPGVDPTQLGSKSAQKKRQETTIHHVLVTIQGGDCAVRLWLPVARREETRASVLSVRIQ